MRGEGREALRCFHCSIHHNNSNTLAGPIPLADHKTLGVGLGLASRQITTKGRNADCWLLHTYPSHLPHQLKPM